MTKVLKIVLTSKFFVDYLYFFFSFSDFFSTFAIELIVAKSDEEIRTIPVHGRPADDELCPKGGDRHVH